MWVEANTKPPSRIKQDIAATCRREGDVWPLIINDWIANVIKSAATAQILVFPIPLTFYWINRKSADFNEKTLPNESAFLSPSHNILNI